MNKLSSESQRLLNVSTAALESAREATKGFAKQSDTLFKASQDASKFTQNIAKYSARQQKDAFMGSAKFIIESLHSLSIDVTRMMDVKFLKRPGKPIKRRCYSLYEAFDGYG